ncbi:MAG: ATP-binding protein, partial [bacterium]|nr:ATP-binding protein [bacterium]
SEVGLHVVIYGERGVGKTSIANVISPVLDLFDGADPSNPRTRRIVIRTNANGEDDFSSLWRRALDEVQFNLERKTIGFEPDSQVDRQSIRGAMGLGDQLSIDEVRRVLAQLKGSVFVFDEFDRMPRAAIKPFTDLIKALSDYSIDCTIILVGVSETIDDLLADHESISRAIVQVHMPRMEPKELREILEKAQQALGVQFDDLSSKRIVQLSQGLPHYTHLLGQNSVRAACDKEALQIKADHVTTACVQAVRFATQGVMSKYSNAVHSSHPGALYESVLTACALAAFCSKDEQGFFQAAEVVGPLGAILNREVKIATFNRHLADLCNDEHRARVLERRGEPRSYRYRFRDPLMTPYVLIKAVSGGTMTESQFEAIVENA